MKLLIDIKDLDNYKSRDLIPLECQHCRVTFYKQKHFIQITLKGTNEKKRGSHKFCSLKCQGLNQRTRIEVECTECQKTFEKFPCEIKKSPNHFCSQRCGGLYNSQHRTTGTRRSKLEKWLEIKLNNIYPKLEIKYNNTSAIKAELDIYIPCFSLAFELNGPFHYEPIFGIEKLTDIQKRDKRKILTCAENNIELCIIDVSTQKYFKEKTCLPFLKIITDIINSKLGADVGNLSATMTNL